MAKRYNITYFVVRNQAGENFCFMAYSTNTRNGFCHTVVTLYRNDVTDTKTSYLNRTWESYNFESTLIRAIKKLGMEYENVNVFETYNGNEYQKHSARA